MLQVLADSGQFVLPYDNLLLSTTKRLLSETFSKYDGAADDAADDAYQAVLQGVQLILGEARTTGSELGACLLIPLVLAIGSAVNRHYQGIICQKMPDLRVTVVKPTYQIDAERSGLDLQVANEGSGAAEGSTLSIQVPPGAGLSIEPENMSFGRLDPG
jgi:hypothetical protein